MKFSRAFTLIELSIVLTIISLIIGGVLLGRNLQNSAKLNRVVEDIKIITKAIEEYEQKYKQLPGDTWNPTDLFAANAINGDPATTIGNGNGTIDGNEGLYAFQHLVLAGILEGNYDGTWNFQKMYKGPYDDSVYYLSSGYGDNVVIRFSRFTGAAVNSGAPILSIRELMEIESKLDDGKASTGLIRGYGATCLSAGEYNMTFINDDSPRCYFDIRVKKSVYSAD